MSTAAKQAPGHRAAGAAKEGDALLEGEFRFTYDDFRRISEMLHADAGIDLPESKTALVYSRLAKRLRALGLENFRDYCALVKSAEGADERKRMLAALTTNVTRFFREPHHFEHLKAQVLPPLAERARRGGRVRIWSAGCSNGQEPYSIALTILALMPDAADHDVRILATDIDPNMVAEGRAGVYSGEQVSAIPRELRDRWFSPTPDRRWAADDTLRALVSFREHNLTAAWPMKGPFDAIFCRNCVIYFREETQNQIWAKFKSLLAPNACLYVGHSERVECTGDDFASDGLTVYRLRGRARA